MLFSFSVLNFSLEELLPKYYWDQYTKSHARMLICYIPYCEHRGFGRWLSSGADRAANDCDEEKLQPKQESAISVLAFRV